MLGRNNESDGTHAMRPGFRSRSPRHPRFLKNARGRDRARGEKVIAVTAFIFLAAVSPISAQVSPEKHARHHPGWGATSPAPGMQSSPQAGSMGPGMSGEMGEMMGGMH